MKNKLILVALVLALSATSCNFPGFLSSSSTAEPTPTPDNGMLFYDGVGLQIMLPPTYVTKDIHEDLPSILNILTSALGESSSTLSTIVENLESNVAWWGYDSSAPAISPTKLLIIKNKELAGLPVNLISNAFGLFLSDDANTMDSDQIELGGRDVARFTYAKESNAWAGYVFKEQDLLWLVLFITTSANLAAQQADYEFSVGSIILDPVTADPQP
ncbi:MAG: hypothetical protein ABFD05_00175 [Anaerolineaceae bacterium]